MNKRAILFTLEFPPEKGGVARYLSTLAIFLQKELGDKFYVVAPKSPRGISEDRLAGRRVVRQTMFWRWLWPRWLPALFGLFLRRNSYDQAIISHILPLGLAAWLMNRLFGKSYIVILHGMDFALARRNQWKRFLSRLILRSARLIVTNTKYLENEVCAFVKTRATTVIYPSVSSNLLSAARQLISKSDGSQSPDHLLRLLTVSRLVPRKGHLLVLEALAALREQGRLPRLLYIIIGDGPLAAKINERIRELGLRAVVSMERNVTDASLINFYRQADIFVMPVEQLDADKEGFGTVYIEASAFGLPVIGSDLPGVREAIQNGQSGLLVQPSSVQDVADAIEILCQNRPRRIELGEFGRHWVLDNFTPEKQCAVLRPYLS